MFKSKGTGFNCKDGTKESKVAKRKFLNEDIKQEMRLMHMASGMIHFKNGKDTRTGFMSSLVIASKATTRDSN